MSWLRGPGSTLIVAALVVPLAVPGSPLDAQNSEPKQEEKREKEKNRKKKARKVWTNDDFPPRRSQPETKKPAALTAEEKALLDSYKELGPEERQILINELERDIREIPSAIETLREQYFRETNQARRRRLRQERERLEGLLPEKQRELELLRRSAPPSSEAASPSN